MIGVPSLIRAFHFCPACARVAQEGGRTVVYLHGRLCGYHRGQYAKLLRDVNADQVTIDFWLLYIRA